MTYIFLFSQSLLLFSPFIDDFIYYLYFIITIIFVSIVSIHFTYIDIIYIPVHSLLSRFSMCSRLLFPWLRSKIKHITKRYWKKLIIKNVLLSFLLNHIYIYIIFHIVNIIKLHKLMNILLEKFYYILSFYI